MDDLTKLGEPEPAQANPERESLLKKYDIPIHHLDFEYVEKCTNAKELEKILHILQSGQEGHYPQLMQTTAECLAKIKPSSRYIREVTQILDSKCLGQEEQAVLKEDLSAWLQDVHKNNKELTKAKKGARGDDLPEIRQAKSHTEEKTTKEINPRRIKSTDYASWDKYDPDTEILKMDLETEKIKEQIKTTKKENTKKERTVKFSTFSTKAEAAYEADREREKGNEYYRAGEYKLALTHYTNSINFLPTVNNYNNRAMTNIKLNHYENAIKDCNAALKYDRNNIKALLRLSQSKEALNELEDALDNAEKAIKIDPNNTTGQNIINRLKNRMQVVHASPKTRMKIVEITDDEPQKIAPQSILKRRHRRGENILLPIPGPSNMPEPYFISVECKDPKIIKQQEHILNNRPQMLYMTNVEGPDDDCDCLEIHVLKSDSKFNYRNMNKENHCNRTNLKRNKLANCNNQCDTINSDYAMRCCSSSSSEDCSSDGFVFVDKINGLGTEEMVGQNNGGCEVNDQNGHNEEGFVIENKLVSNHKKHQNYGKEVTKKGFKIEDLVNTVCKDNDDMLQDCEDLSTNYSDVDSVIGNISDKRNNTDYVNEDYCENHDIDCVVTNSSFKGNNSDLSTNEDYCDKHNVDCVIINNSDKSNKTEFGGNEDYCDKHNIDCVIINNSDESNKIDFCGNEDYCDKHNWDCVIIKNSYKEIDTDLSTNYYKHNVNSAVKINSDKQNNKDSSLNQDDCDKRNICDCINNSNKGSNNYFNGNYDYCCEKCKVDCLFTNNSDKRNNTDFSTNEDYCDRQNKESLILNNSDKGNNKDIVPVQEYCDKQLIMDLNENAPYHTNVTTATTTKVEKYADSRGEYKKDELNIKQSVLYNENEVFGNNENSINCIMQYKDNNNTNCGAGDKNNKNQLMAEINQQSNSSSDNKINSMKELIVIDKISCDSHNNKDYCEICNDYISNQTVLNVNNNDGNCDKSNLDSYVANKTDIGYHSEICNDYILHQTVLNVKNIDGESNADFSVTNKTDIGYHSNDSFVARNNAANINQTDSFKNIKDLAPKGLGCKRKELEFNGNYMECNGKGEESNVKGLEYKGKEQQCKENCLECNGGLQNNIKELQCKENCLECNGGLQNNVKELQCKENCLECNGGLQNYVKELQCKENCLECNGGLQNNIKKLQCKGKGLEYKGKGLECNGKGLERKEFYINSETTNECNMNYAIANVDTNKDVVDNNYSADVIANIKLAEGAINVASCEHANNVDVGVQFENLNNNINRNIENNINVVGNGLGRNNNGNNRNFVGTVHGLQHNDNGGGGEPFRNSTNNNIRVEEVHIPYSFLKMWTSAKRDNTYVQHAEVLRHLDFNRLTEVIGFKMDGTMLSDILHTLHNHFTVAHEIDRVNRILTNITSMPRFNIISLFLSSNDKIKLKCLFEFLEQHGKPLAPDVKQLYM